MSWPISLEHLTVAPADPVHLIDIAAELGCPMVVPSVRATPGYAATHDMVVDAGLVRRTAARSVDMGVEVRAISSLRLQAQFDMDEALRIMDVGVALKARHVLVTGYDPDHSRTAERFLDVCERAETRGLGVILEPVSYAIIGTLNYGAELAAMAKSPRVGLLVDVLHLYRSGGSVGDLRAIDPALVLHAQISDGPLKLDPAKRTDESRWRRGIPGEAELPLREFIRALPAGTPVGMEVPLKDFTDLGKTPLERARVVHAATKKLVDSA